ncbi:MAG: DAK2 domain-containing protein [Ruminococcaceae bacterium]|nr:DAK2 domain-containing protein [Oscillospiraceae bacterium]
MDKNTEKDTGQLLDGKLLAQMAQGGAALLRSNAEEVNRLNVFPVPDGDTGDNMRMTIESGIAALEKVDSSDLAEVMKTLSHGMLLGARGNSGVILSQLFAGMAKGFDNCEKADPTAIGHALTLGVKQAYNSVMTPTEGTILTVARESVEYAVARITSESTIRSFFADLVKEMNASLNRTPDLLINLKEAGVVDSGGAGLLYIMDGFNRILNGEEIKSEPLPTNEKKPLDLSGFTADSEMTYGYCTELLLQLQNSKVDAESFNNDIITEFLCGVGDSVVSFKTGTIVKIHVHTLTPDKVLAFCRQFGEFLTVKIENMSVQHSELPPEEKPAAAPAVSTEKKKYGMVAVASGKGIADTFLELGVDTIVEGGQTQNPSTNDFLDAFAKVNAEHIFVFPNNGNILMAAKQAAEIYENAAIHVIESKNLGDGYVAICAADFDCDDAAAIAESFKEAMANVTTGNVSPSIRDAELNGVQIKNGDFIGFVGKQMLTSNKEITDTTHALVDKMLENGEKFMLTVFCGKDCTAEAKADLEGYLADAHSDIEAYFIDGDQDVYPFIFVAE